MGAHVDPETGEALSLEHASAAAPPLASTVAQFPSAPETPEEKELRDKIDRACVSLGYDAVKTRKALDRTRGMSLTEMQDALRALEAEGEKRETAVLRAAVNKYFEEQGWDEGDQRRYLTDHHGGVAVDQMTLDQLVAVKDDLNIKL